MQSFKNFLKPTKAIFISFFVFLILFLILWAGAFVGFFMVFPLLLFIGIYSFVFLPSELLDLPVKFAHRYENSYPLPMELSDYIRTIGGIAVEVVFIYIFLSVVSWIWYNWYNKDMSEQTSFTSKKMRHYLIGIFVLALVLGFIISFPLGTFEEWTRF